MNSYKRFASSESHSDYSERCCYVPRVVRKHPSLFAIALVSSVIGYLSYILFSSRQNRIHEVFVFENDFYSTAALSISKTQTTDLLVSNSTKEFVDSEDEERKAFSTKSSQPKYRTCTMSFLKDEKKLLEKCAGWIDILTKWQKDIDSFSNAVYQCNGGNCHGIGDRLAGIQSVLTFAVNNQQRLILAWDGLKHVFEPSCYMNDVAVLIKQKLGKKIRESKILKPPLPERKLPLCKSYMKYQSELNLSMTRNASMIFTNIYRNCEFNMCGRLKKLQPKATFGSDTLIGCPLKLLLQPSASFLSYSVSMFIEGSVQQMQLKDALSLLSRYYMIGIHVRHGDKAFTNTNTTESEAWNYKTKAPFRCADIVKDDMIRTGQVNDKPVKYLLASDSNEYRHQAKLEYKDSLIMVDSSPFHLSHMNRQQNHEDDTLRHTFTEWLLLSAVDEVVLNKYSRNQQELYKGRRLSAFSVSARSYGLNPLYYDAVDCKKKPISFTGTYSDFQKCGPMK